MTTPTTPEGLAQFDHLPPLEAAIAAWTNPGSHPQWHALKQRLVREQMPLLGRALDRAAERGGAGPASGALAGDRRGEHGVIKAAGEIGGRKFMLLGLSGENVARLAAGEPIAFDGDQLGYEGKVVIVYGRTEAEIAAQLREHGLVPPDEGSGG